MASEPRVLQAACLAPGRGPSSDLGAAVIRTLQAARAPSTRGLYAGRWNRFCGWCRSRGENPVSCGASVVLAFLQSLLESGLSVSTLRGYVAAISSHHKLVDGLTMGTQAIRSGVGAPLAKDRFSSGHCLCKTCKWAACFVGAPSMFAARRGRLCHLSPPEPGIPGSPPYVIWNSVDPYCGVLTDMK